MILPSSTRRRAAGFTLVELMVVVAIIGILATGAATGYRFVVVKAQEVEGEAALRRLKQHEDDFYIVQLRYSDDKTEIGFPSSPPLQYYSVGVELVPDDPDVDYRATATPLPNRTGLHAWVLTARRDRNWTMERVAF